MGLVVFVFVLVVTEIFQKGFHYEGCKWCIGWTKHAVCFHRVTSFTAAVESPGAHLFVSLSFSLIETLEVTMRSFLMQNIFAECSINGNRSPFIKNTEEALYLLSFTNSCKTIKSAASLFFFLNELTHCYFLQTSQHMWQWWPMGVTVRDEPAAFTLNTWASKWLPGLFFGPCFTVKRSENVQWVSTLTNFYNIWELFLMYCMFSQKHSRYGFEPFLDRNGNNSYCWCYSSDTRVLPGLAKDCLSFPGSA